MGFPGQIAQGANNELAELFRRQMVEAQQQEQQRQFNARLLQDRAEMAQRGRIADTEQGQRQHIIDRQDATEAADATSPGAISETTAGILRKSPATAGRVTQRQTLEARPMPGTAPLDESGQKDYSVMEPTPQQARQQGQDAELRRISGLLRSAGNESQRRQVGAEALGAGLNVPNALLEPTQAETERVRATEIERQNNEWNRREGVQENNIRTRPQRAPRSELTPGQAFSATRQLRNDFVRETAAARTVTQQLGLMKSSLAAAEKGDMAAGSQGVLVTFQKILDPNSVVRESEYARSASGQALLSRIEGAVAKLAQGGAGIPLSELKAFVSLGEQFVANQSKAANEAKSQVDAIASEYGLNPDHITRDFDAGAPDAGAGGGGGVIRKPIPGIAGGEAESADGGKTWKRVK